jgi:hypothetical protein
VQGFSFFFTLHDSIYRLATGVCIVVTVENEPHANFAGSALRPVACIAPFGARQVNEDGWESEWVHIDIFVVESFQLSVVFVHGACPR